MGSKSAIGIGNGICFKQVRDKGGGSCIDPLVRDSIVGLWKFDQNTNESPTRNIIKNTIKDKGGDLELLNFGYKLNSGYGGYVTDFTEWKSNNTNRTQTKITVSKDTNFPVNLASFENATNAPSFRIKVSGLPKGQNLYYRYINEEGLLEENFYMFSDGIYTLPATAVTDTPTKVAMLANEQYNINIKGLTIEQLPLHEGALVTDGKDDMIVSQKTVQEMGVTNEITVVSMIHQIGIRSEYNRAFNNYIRNQNVGFIRNNIAGVGIDKTGIYGYTWNNSTKSVINNILGDKNDYSIEAGVSVSIEGKFTVEGYINNGSPDEISEVAVYWTFIANKVLTTDEINQIIGYFKLDKYVTPQVIYDVKRQGLTNDTPNEDWYLKDFSGNGHDMTLYNFAKKLDSGVGKWAADYTAWTKIDGVVVTPTRFKIVEEISSDYWLLFLYNTVVPAHKIKVSGIPKGGTLKYAINSVILENGINELPEMEADSARGFTISMGTTQFSDWVGLSVEQIPDYEGALVSDGKDDYGKAEGLHIFKDYTVAADRAIVDDLITNADGGVFSKSTTTKDGAFIFNYKDQIFSFGSVTNKKVNTNRFISYQSKYINNGKSISAGSMADVNHLLLAKLALENNRYSALALYSMLLFPYSLSEFLLERQLKRYKLGTLYPGMIEWRPIVKSNIPYKQIDYFIKRSGVYVRLNPGDYFQSTEDIIVRVTPIRDWQLDVVSSIKVNGKNEVISVNSSYAQTASIHIDKSPQKIDITIDEYIRFEDIVQPYPMIVNLSQDGKILTWGDKLKVGSEVVVTNYTILLPELYTHGGGIRYNGTTINLNVPIIVDKSMVFTNVHTWKLNTTEPHAIYSPQKLNIPNSSLKILGYVPDLTGKGNHGRLNNFAYTEESGANEDGSIRFDGTDDHITIPTLAHGGKCVMMKVNSFKTVNPIYEQRNPNIFLPTFCIFMNNTSIAYVDGNNGKTYIDGVLNSSITGGNLANILHNITVTNENVTTANSVSPKIGVLNTTNTSYADMAMYEFMLFPEIPSEDEIKKLNDVMGIEGGYVESPNSIKGCCTLKLLMPYLLTC